MPIVERWMPLVGRVLLVAIFLASGANKIFNWEQTAGYMASKGMPAVDLFLAGAIVLELVGGLSIVVGYRARLGALALILFLIPATLIFHDFWSYEGPEQKMQMIMFMKNLSMMGGLLFIVGLGPGPVSLDACRQCCATPPKDTSIRAS